MNRFIILILLVSTTIISCVSTSKWVVPKELIGKWNTQPHKITVRTEPKWMKFEFTSDSAVVSIQINDNKTVIGNIGSASFSDGIVSQNTGDPSITGIAYIIKCGKIGKIFKTDPLESKEVEIWLSPIDKNMKAEIRYAESGDKFPMAGLVFEKEIE